MVMVSDSLSELEEFMKAAQAARPDDAEEFGQLFDRGMRLLRLVDTDLAREFGASLPTVTRWRNGTNAPHPAMRRPIYSWLEKRAATLIRQERTAPEGGSSVR